MSLKILGGVARSFSLDVPKGQLIRPTSVLLKRRLFDSIQSFEGSHFYDLCAGSGAIGLEAYSRGAESVTLLESSRKVFNIMNSNVERFSEHYIDDFSNRTISTFNKSCVAFCKKQNFGSEDIVFLDPPYVDHDTYSKCIEAILGIKNSRTCQLWIESDNKKGLTLEYWESLGLSAQKVFKQGDSYIALF